MVRITKQGITQELDGKLLSFLLQEMKEFRTKEDLDRFLNQLLTTEEQIMMKKRLAIHLFLREGRKVKDIRKILDVSKTTIGFVRRGLKSIPKQERKITSRGFNRSVYRSRFPYPAYKGRGRWRFLSSY